VSLTLSRKISRKHCCIAQVNNSFVVRDLGSTNGVFLNGNRIKKEATIEMGDDLVIGDVHFRLQNEATLGPGKQPVANGSSAGQAPNKEKWAQPLTKAQPPIGQPASASLKNDLPPLSMDIPVALPEGDLDFDVELTNPKQKPIPNNPRVDDVIPLRDDEIDEEDDEFDEPMRLASDSF
jgi:hypothetical protein